MIDEKASKIPIWLIWATTDNGLTTLVGIILTNTRAVSYRKIIASDPRVITVKIEPSEANHLFNPDWDTEWQRAYGEAHLAKLAEQVGEIDKRRIASLEYELSQTEETLRKATRRIEELEALLKGNPS